MVLVRILMSKSGFEDEVLIKLIVLFRFLLHQTSVTSSCINSLSDLVILLFFYTTLFNTLCWHSFANMSSSHSIKAGWCVLQAPSAGASDHGRLNVPPQGGGDANVGHLPGVQGGGNSFSLLQPFNKMLIF
jgi:hypothetical protein